MAATGCFDCLHVGHLNLFSFAKSLGDWLLVGINDDESIRKLKGPTRPIVPEDQRLFHVSAIRWVDEAEIFHGDTVVDFILDHRINVWVKGSYRNLSTINPLERQAAKSIGCKIVFCPTSQTSAPQILSKKYWRQITRQPINPLNRQTSCAINDKE